jgi:plastocyanin
MKSKIKKTTYNISTVWWWLALSMVFLIIIFIAWSLLMFIKSSNEKSSEPQAYNTPSATYFDGAPIPSKISESNLTLHLNSSTYVATLVSVSYGTKIIWVNDDSVVHTVTSDDGKFDSGDIAPGGKFGLVFSEQGDYTYHCKYHPSEQSKLVVK